MNGDMFGGKHSQMQSGECIMQKHFHAQKDREVERSDPENVYQNVSAEHIYCVLDLLVESIER